MNIMMNAVSGVVGVILMVTITTIISVLVGAMVFGFANTKEPHFVAFSLSKYGEEFRLTLSGGEVSAIDECRVFRNSELLGNFSREDLGRSINFQALPGDRILVVCKFYDGSESIVYEKLI